MPNELESLLTIVKEDAFNDFQVENLLKEVLRTRSDDEIFEACFAVLTGNSYPPSFRLTCAALRAIVKGGKVSRLWERMYLQIQSFASPQVSNFVSAFYNWQYDDETFDRFSKFVEIVTRNYDKLSIGNMFSTWEMDSSQKIRVMNAVRSLTDKIQEDELSPEERLIFHRLKFYSR